MIHPRSFTGLVVALPAATATELLTAAGFEIADFTTVGILLTNAGANPITGMSVYWSCDSAGSRWSPADLSIVLPGGTLASGASMLIERSVTCRRMRISLTSAVGSSVIVDFNGAWGGGAV